MDSELSKHDWIETNAQRVSDALSRPEVLDELYRLLGGEPDAEAVREALAHEVARLRLECDRDCNYRLLPLRADFPCTSGSLSLPSFENMSSPVSRSNHSCL